MSIQNTSIEGAIGGRNSGLGHLSLAFDPADYAVVIWRGMARPDDATEELDFGKDETNNLVSVRKNEVAVLTKRQYYRAIEYGAILDIVTE